MKNPLLSDGASNLGLLLLRVPMGAYFAVAGYNKISGGVRSFVDAQAKNIPGLLPDFLGKTYLFLLPFAEVAVGLMLVLGLWTRVPALVAALMLVSFMVAVTGVTDGGKPFHANVVFLGVTLALVCLGGGEWALARLWGKRAARNGGRAT